MATADASAKADKKLLAEQRKAEKQAKVEAKEKKALEKAEKAERPKKAKSAYMLFTDDIRGVVMTEMKAKSGKVDLGTVAKLIGERWGSLAEDEKSKYQARAAEGKDKAEGEMKAYKEKKDPVGALKEKYADLIPKKPSSAYWLFQLDSSSRLKATEALGQNAPHKEITAKLGEMWKGMTADAKAPFEKLLQGALKEYEEKLKKWQVSPEFMEIAKLEAEQKTPELSNKRACAELPEIGPVKIAKTAEPEPREVLIKKAEGLGF